MNTAGGNLFKSLNRNWPALSYISKLDFIEVYSCWPKESTDFIKKGKLESLDAELTITITHLIANHNFLLLQISGAGKTIQEIAFCILSQ